MASPAGPFKLVTVNTAPERAKRLVGKVVEDLKDQFTIIHAANCEGIPDVEPTVKDIQPDMLMCASMWTNDQAKEIEAIARKEIPNIKFHAIPHGLQVEKGPEAIVEHLMEVLPRKFTEEK
ncbi:MAG: hypothetical protein Q9227_005614 [Pyrenula ochraceoflavens]